MRLTVGDLRRALLNPILRDDAPVWLDGDHEFAHEIMLEETDFGEGDFGLILVGGH